MITIHKTVTPSSEQWQIIIEGMRNPMNSWDRSDSWFDPTDKAYIGENDLSLMKNLASAGTDHRKFMRMIPVWLTVTAPLYWWKEYDTYKVGTVANSCSTMHKIHEKEFTVDDFSYERTVDEKIVMRTIDCTLNTLNYLREKYLETKKKEYWDSMIQLLPSSYNQKRTIFLNYENLLNIYRARKNHKLDEWKKFCKAIETLPYFMEVCGG